VTKNNGRGTTKVLLSVIAPRARKWSRKIFTVLQTALAFPVHTCLMKAKSELLVQLGVAVVVVGLLLVVLHWY